MNHAFTGTGDICARCKYPVIAHTDKATCECCPNIGTVEIRYGNMLMCDECWQKEQKLSAENMALEEQQKRVNKVLAESRKIDQSIQVKTDIFNAATIASVELKAAIQQDENIPSEKKQQIYAETCLERYLKLKQVIFEEREAFTLSITQKENELRMWQTQAQQAASMLRAEFREKFKQLDVTYQPAKPKTVKPKETKVGKKFNLEEIRKFAAQYNVPMASVQSIVIAKNMSPEDAAKHMRKAMDGVK